MSDSTELTTFTGWAATSAGAPLERYSYDPGPLGEEEVEVAVEYCGVCHSDQSMIDNEWGLSHYPFIPGHEVVGSIVRVGAQVRGLEVGQRVGIGWYKGSCMHCSSCIGGSHNLCNTVQPTIVGSNGGFADRLRSHWAWALAIPDGLDPAMAGPLFCAGSTVFNPLVEFDVKPTDRVGVVGIGGLGHLALRFLNAWGCEVTAFTSSLSKQDEARRLGAHNVLASTDSNALKAIAGTLDFLLVTANADLDWPAMLGTLRGKGRLHFVGVVPGAIPVHVFNLLPQQKSLSASPVGSPANTATMLEFCARHQILPQVEHFPMSRINDAIDHLRSGKARYRVVLDASK
ncbi:NAD(P)-dependent alcohol dehydrogenase [Pseudomonas frederiksbergensis]|uniref:NADPH-dependent aldehyde reductase Ahr n=1 Tax=Pseudomonas frederiksbergensis TaxID=104087 RepID=UPI0019802082|nr:NAD(P)-dependent alcohol dehydrogenase [Pseudomonas frederiksbergensis]MBN3862425.1 NAD(P)-dependent alcohol dehydrogenase [Pseudomonas frederiksbergensis]